MTVRFISYIPTPGEKHFGIATVSLDDKVVLRYKVGPSKHGGTYVFPACYKIQDKYEPCFIIDSNITKMEIDNIIRDNVTDQQPEHPKGTPF